MRRRIVVLGSAALLATAAFSMGACGDDDTDDGTVELPADALEVYHDYTAALVAGDGEAMLDYVTDDFTWLSYGTNLMEADDRAEYVTNYYGGFSVEEIGDYTVVGEGDEFIFSVPEQATTPVFADGISLVKMVNVDGGWLLAAHRFLGEGEGSG